MPIKKEIEAAMLSVLKEKRPTICFLCLGNEKIDCKVCRMTLSCKIHLQNHAFKIHRTRS